MPARLEAGIERGGQVLKPQLFHISLCIMMILEIVPAATTKMPIVAQTMSRFTDERRSGR